MSDDYGSAGFLALLRLDEAGPDRWRGRGRGRGGGTGAERLSRGLLAAQSMVAAGRTTDTRWRWAHSVHVTYLAAGAPAGEVDYRVERLCDSEYRATRLVRVVQEDRLLAVATVAFQAPRLGVGPVHQEAHPGESPDPHSLPSVRDVGAGVPVDIRYLDRAPWEPPAGLAAANRIWVRFTEEIPDEILVHSAAVVFAADLLLVEPVTPPSAGEWTDLGTGQGLHAVGLDLSVRFHRSFRADDWILHEHRSPSSADYRVYSTGRLFSPLGRLIASVSQEQVLLPVAESAGQGEEAAFAAEAAGTPSAGTPSAAGQ